MTLQERTAILRIFIDFIKADTVLDAGEMAIFQSFKRKYSLSSDLQVDSVTLADAFNLLKSSIFSEKERMALLDDVRNLSLSDGSCTKSEALLLIALELCLTEDAELISVNVPNLSIAEEQILYVESKHTPSAHKAITEHYRQLALEFKQAGLNFVYIPKVAEHYQQTDSNLFSEICGFLAPAYDETKRRQLEEYMKNITTARFCIDQLYGKLGMSSLYDTAPAFLVSIGSSFVNSKLYHNFLKVDFKTLTSVVSQLLDFVDRYVKLLSCDVVIIPKSEEVNGQFLYSGYYKQLFDIYLLKNTERSPILIDATRENIFLPIIDRKLDGPIHTKEKAYYALVLFEMQNGGLNFRLPSSAKELESYNRRFEVYQKRFNALYRLLGGSVGNEPNLSIPETRQQMKSRINKYFKQSADILYQSSDYMLQLDKKGNLTVRLDSSLFLVRTKTENDVNLISSTINSQLSEIK